MFVPFLEGIIVNFKIYSKYLDNYRLVAVPFCQSFSETDIKFRDKWTDNIIF